MKAQLVYISCGAEFEQAEIQKALDDIRAQLKLPRDVILFGMPIEQAPPAIQPVDAPAAEAPKSILGKLVSTNTAPSPADNTLSSPASDTLSSRASDEVARPGTSSIESEEPESDLPDSLEDILGNISPLDQAEPLTAAPALAAPRGTSEFPESVHELAREMGSLSDEDFQKINEGLLSKTAKGVSDLLNVIPFRTKSKKKNDKYQPAGPNLFTWGGDAANNADDRFDFPDALKGLI